MSIAAATSQSMLMLMMCLHTEHMENSNNNTSMQPNHTYLKRYMLWRPFMHQFYSMIKKNWCNFLSFVSFANKLPINANKTDIFWLFIKLNSILIHLYIRKIKACLFTKLAKDANLHRTNHENWLEFCVLPVYFFVFKIKSILVCGWLMYSCDNNVHAFTRTQINL